MKKKLTPWRSGPPPCDGWWIASAFRDSKIRRHWNGESWSKPVQVGDKDAYMKLQKSTPSDICLGEMEWRGLAEKPE